MRAAALATLLPLAAVAQTPFAGEDFDGGTTNGGFTAATTLLVPDLSGSPIRSAFDPTATDGGSGVREDRFGEVSRLDQPDGLPFGVADDSVSIFTADTAGFVAETKTDDFFLSVDTENNFNAGPVSATWTFDITGRTGLGLSIDFGMFGDFEESDVYNFTYSIDGSAPLPAFSIIGESGTFYDYAMDNGTFFEGRVPSRFFSSDDWDFLTQIGEAPGDIEFHPDDDGMTNGDTTAQDGFIPVEFREGIENVRAMLDTNANGTFEEQEFDPVTDPLVITTGDGSVTAEIIPADFTTFTTALQGTGETLTLMLDGESNGGGEYFAFDNIVLTESEVTGTFGDFEPDGDVDIIDFGVFADAFGSVTGDANYLAAADSEPDGDVDIIDFGLFADNFGIGTATAVPEPTTALLAALALAGLASRRNG